MAAPSGPAGFQFAIDRGGTFTDVFARCPGGRVRVLKLLSEDPAYGDAPTEGIRRVLQEERGVPVPRDQPLDTSGIEWIRMGTTVATNALLERRGERLALLVTRGFRDLLHIGTQARPRIFDLEVAVPEVLYEEVIEVDERLIPHQPGCRLPGRETLPLLEGSMGTSLLVQRPLELSALRRELERVLARGIRSLAVLLLHSYAWPGHEEQVGALARELGFQHVSLSSAVAGMVRAVPRGYTACADAYLTPCIQRYLGSFRHGFARQLREVPVLFIALGRGPDPDAALQRGPRHPLGAGRRRGGLRRHHLRPPRRAARHRLRHGRGPVDRHRRQPVPGPPAPRVFPAYLRAGRGPAAVPGGGGAGVSGFGHPYRRLRSRRRLPPAAVGGGGGHGLRAGGQRGHVPAHPRPDAGAGSRRRPPRAGLFWGCGGAARLRHRPRPGHEQGLHPQVQRGALGLRAGAGGRGARGPGALRPPLRAGCLRPPGRAHRRAAAGVPGRAAGSGLRRGADPHRGVPAPALRGHRLRPDVLGQGAPAHPRLLPRRRLPHCLHQPVPAGVRLHYPRPARGGGRRAGARHRQQRRQLRHPPGPQRETGPCGDGDAVLLRGGVPGDAAPSWWSRAAPPASPASATSPSPSARGPPRPVGPQLDAVQLSIFSHRFMSIAEQMGRILQRTAISTNIKERLDFSCALFGPDGGLVSNAPHIPVHLGAMQETVQFQIRNLGEDLREGDVILSNHPCAGGSHLPDLTVITPVFWPGVPKPVFFVASRGHHADIGGVTPGSMPPHSKALREEGAVFVSFKLVKDGVFQEEAVTEALMAPGRVPGCSGTRNLPDNLSDLRAQVAANQKGIQLVTELIRLHGLAAVQAYMAHIQANAEVAVREMLKGFAARWGTALEAEDRMDDGSPIRLRVQVDPQEGSAVFDFSGSGPEVYGNCNAPRAITLSALIYCLRCMVGQDIPLNQGCLAPVRVVIPKGSILDPSPEAAVVGGNVLTSQRVVDVIFRAFGVCAASQGCMNNVTFGNERVGYYETVAGGAGGRPTLARPRRRPHAHDQHPHHRPRDPGAAVGAGTRGGYRGLGLTPPPRVCVCVSPRYPVVLQRFELRRGSGGAGRCRGGDGVVRELLFREELVLSVLSERRAVRPYGLRGGSPGAPGLNLLLRRDGRTINLGAKTSVTVEPGDVFRLQTPGGGGFGSPKDGGDPEEPPEPPAPRSFAERGERLRVPAGARGRL
ncbi:unnamed protein product, partial [Bubo scandiacus]